MQQPLISSARDGTFAEIKRDTYPLMRHRQYQVPDDVITLLHKIEDHPEEFTVEFWKWLPDNIDIWTAFCAQCMAVVEHGFTHYSANTILSYLRHHTLLSSGNVGFKIDSEMSAYLARLWKIVYPQFESVLAYRSLRSGDLIINNMERFERERVALEYADLLG